MSAGARAGVGRSRSGRGGSAAERGHPGLGVGLIAGALGAAPAWTSIVAGHHERLDGSGYPGGHRGTRLSRPVRIAGLADTFASLVTPAAWGHLRTADEAIGVLRLGTQARFGEDLVWALVRVLEAGELLPRAGTGVAATTH
jgi:putative two-component system response regulator